MKGLIYTLYLNEPVLVSGPEGDPNSSVSLPFVPGSVLRGMVIQLAAGDLDPADAATRRRYFDPAARFLHAYPMYERGPGDNVRAVPPPLSWKKPRYGNENKIYDLLISQPEEAETLDPFKGYAYRIGHSVYEARLKHEVNIHTQRNARLGRATRQSGAVFRYQALAPGQRLCGCILTENDDDLAYFKQLLEGRTLQIGKARTAGYGRVTVETIFELEPTWSELEAAINEFSEYTSVGALCVSEVIVRDESGQCSLDLAPALEKVLQVPTRVLKRQGEPLLFRRSQPVGGFNRKWGLPLPQETALAAGSIVALEFGSPISGARLLALEASGLGERRCEGFGRIAFLPYPPDTTGVYSLETSVEQAASPDPAEEEQALAALTPEQRQFAERLLHRMLRQKLENSLQQFTSQAQILGERRPSKSQLGRWRVFIRAALAAGQDDRLLLNLANEKEKKTPAWRAFTRCRIQIGGETHRLAAWIEDVLHNPGSPWNYLVTMTKIGKGDPLGLWLGSGPQAVQARPGQQEAFEYRLKLLDRMFEKLAKTHPEEAKHG